MALWTAEENEGGCGEVPVDEPVLLFPIAELDPVVVFTPAELDVALLTVIDTFPVPFPPAAFCWLEVLALPVELDVVCPVVPVLWLHPTANRQSMLTIAMATGFRARMRHPLSPSCSNKDLGPHSDLYGTLFQYTGRKGVWDSNQVTF